MTVSGISPASSATYVRQSEVAGAGNDGDADDKAGASAVAGTAPPAANDGDADDSAGSALTRSSASVQAALTNLTMGG